MASFGAVRARALLCVVVLAACGDVAQEWGPGPAAGQAPVSVTPATARALAGTSVRFTANRDVTWTIDEGPAGGIVTGAGVYTAPWSAGTFHVRAWAGSLSAAAAVTVELPPASCASFTYAPWSSCSATGTQTRTVTSSSPAGCTGGSPVLARSCTPPPPASAYDALVLSDRPVAYWGMSSTTATELDLTGNGHAGTYRGGQPPTVAMPNGDRAVDLDGSGQYLSVPSSAAFSIPTTGSLTWEAWIRPDTLQFPNDGADGYVDWMGKCESYAPTCEWEARMYSATNPEGRPNRFSAYAFNPSAGLGSGAYWQPASALIVAGHWYHVVGEYTTLSQPASCPSSPSYPGSIQIWVNGVPWNQASHSPTGCMSQYGVRPVAGGSPLDIGTTSLDSWFRGAVGKVAIYGHLLTQQQIDDHYQAMTGSAPSGSCGASCTLTDP